MTDAPAREPPPSFRGLLVVAAAVFVAAAAVYAPAIRGVFISDDNVLIASNPAVRSLGAAFESFGRSFWHGLKSVAPYYRPLVTLTFAIDHASAGLDPRFYHATNLLLHAGCAALVALLVPAAARSGAGPLKDAGPLRNAGTRILAGSLFAGLLAALHPLHAEPAATVYGRTDLLASFFALSFLNLALRGRRLLALLCVAAAIFSKESALALPLLAPFAFAMGGRARNEDHAHGRRRPGRWLAASAAAFLILAGYLWMRQEALGAWYDPRAVTKLDNPMVEADTGERWLTALALAGRYAALWGWPATLCADRGFDVTPLADRISDPGVAAGAMATAAFVAALLFLARRRSPWALILAAAAGAYAPVSNTVVLAPAMMAERFLYLPSLLLCALAGGLYARLLGAGPRAPGWPFGRVGMHAVAAVILIAAGTRALVRIPDFRDDLTFNTAITRSCPRSAKAQYNLGNALQRAHRDEEAIDAYARAVDIAPWLAVAHNNMGTSYLNLHRMEEAEAAYRKAIAASPSLMFPRASLAMILYLHGKIPEAMEEARVARALATTPGDVQQIDELLRTLQSRLPPEPGP